ERRPDVAAVYHEGIDTVSHLFTRDTDGTRAIEAAYLEADTLLARLAAAAAPETWVVVCSDHGFFPADAGIDVDPADLAGPASAWHRPYGIVAAAEARTLVASTSPSTGTHPLSVTPLDIAPTLLHAASLPVGSEMPGRVVNELLPPEAASRAVVKQPTP